MNKINYQRAMEDELKRVDSLSKPPKLLLHSCCGPCSTYCIQTLAEHFQVTVFYYNPNIYPPQEYELRAKEQARFIDEFPTKYPVLFQEGHFDPQEFYQKVKGYESIPEGGERCFLCYELRLENTARFAKENDFDYFTTTLSISPLKNAQKLNEIGGVLAEKYQLQYLYSDFKKKEGYKKSTELSKEYGMYRQNYCGCVFSMRERNVEVSTTESEDK